MGIRNRIAQFLVCGVCFRFRFSPVHGLMRALDMCPGDRTPKEHKRKRDG